MSSSSPGTREEERRFPFGENWKRFLSTLDDQRIAEAEQSITKVLEAEDLRGKTFLDIGSVVGCRHWWRAAVGRTGSFL
jgi:hypothetical protein